VLQFNFQFRFTENWRKGFFENGQAVFGDHATLQTADAVKLLPV